MRPFRKWLIIALVGLGIVPTAYLAYLHMQGNFHAVAEERVYRSRQLDKDEMVRYLTTYKIQSVLNLRGTNYGSDWYQDEIRVAHQLGVKHYDYGISANRDVPDQAIITILDIIRDAPKPILIHCNYGADRTGLIAALYQYAMERRSAEEAAGQLSILHGHFPYLWSTTDAMDRTFGRYVNRHPPQSETPVAR